MKINLLSRKLILSVFLAIVATIFMAKDLVKDYEWQWVIMATVVSYVIGASVIKMEVNKKNDNPALDFKTFLDRLKMLFSLDFALTLVTVIVTSYLLYYKHISSTVWFSICSALAGAYNIFNSLSKTTA